MLKDALCYIQIIIIDTVNSQDKEIHTTMQKDALYQYIYDKNFILLIIYKN